MEDIIFYNNEAYNEDLYESYPGSAQYHAAQKTSYSCNLDDYALVYGDPNISYSSVVTEGETEWDKRWEKINEYLTISFSLNGDEYTNGLLYPGDEITATWTSQAPSPNYLETVELDGNVRAGETSEVSVDFEMDKTHRLTFIFADQTRLSFLFVASL